MLIADRNSRMSLLDQQPVCSPTPVPACETLSGSLKKCLFRETIQSVHSAAEGGVPRRAPLCWENVHVLKSPQTFGRFSSLNKSNGSRFKSTSNKAHFYTKRLPVPCWVYVARPATTELSDTKRQAQRPGSPVKTRYRV